VIDNRQIGQKKGNLRGLRSKSVRFCASIESNDWPEKRSEENSARKGFDDQPKDAQIPADTRAFRIEEFAQHQDGMQVDERMQ
jgi:hypothetical protein